MGKSRHSAEKSFMMNPKQLLFTQADIKSTFTDRAYPSVRETASLIRRGLLNPNVLGPLHVCIDEGRRMWCDSNRRLFALREAGVDSISCVCHGNRCPKSYLKRKLSDPAFMPRIRGEASRVQIPPPPTSGRNAYQMQKEPEPSLLGSVSAGYLNRKPYRSHEDELGARFTQLHIKSTSTGPTCPTHRESASSKQRGELNPNWFTQPHIHSNFDPNEFWIPNRRLYSHKDAEDDSVPIGYYGNWSGMNAVESKRNDPAFMPRISGRGLGVRNPPAPTSGRNGYQMEKGTSLLSSISAGYSKRELYNRHEDNEVHYKYTYSYKEEVEVKYQYPVPYGVEGKVGHEHQVLCEAKDDEEEDVYTGIKRLFDGCSTNSKEEYGFGYPFPCEDEVEGNMEGEVEYENPVYTVPCEDEGEVEYHYIPTVFSEDDLKYSVPTVFCEDDFKYSVPTVLSEDDLKYSVLTIFSEDDF